VVALLPALMGGIGHSPLCYVPAMNHGTVRIILEKVISSPANVNLSNFDEAIRWVEGRGTISAG
jgi:hypothetical protein